MERLLAAKSEELSSKHGGSFSGVVDPLHLLSQRMVWSEPAEDVVAQTVYDRHQVVEVVRDPSDQSSDRLHLLRVT